MQDYIYRPHSNGGEIWRAVADGYTIPEDFTSRTDAVTAIADAKNVAIKIGKNLRRLLTTANPCRIFAVQINTASSRDNRNQISKGNAMIGSKSQAKNVRKQIEKLEDQNSSYQEQIDMNNQVIDLYRQTLAKLAPETEVSTNGVLEAA